MENSLNKGMENSMEKSLHEEMDNSMEKEYKYDAFISYRHVEPDQTIAKEIHRMIENFKPPKELYQNGNRTSFRIFRDREELAAKDLSTSIEEALMESHFLIVICSKRTPLSEWCEKEIRTFRALHGDSRIIPLLIEGEPEESFPAPLKQLKGGKEESFLDVLAADIRPEEVLKKDFPGYEVLQKTDKGKLSELTKEEVKLLKTEKYRIIAAILGCNFGDLKQRDKERKNRRILTVSSALGVIFLIFGIFMTNAYQRAEQARQEAVESNAGILLKTAKDTGKDGDHLKAVLIAKEAMKSIREKMARYKSLRGEEISVFNDAIYQSGSSVLTSISTGNKLSFMDLSHNEKYLAFGLDNNETAIASTENGEILKKFSGHTQQVKLVRFSHDDTLLASASFDGTCIIYDVESGEEKKKLEVPGIPMLCMFSEDDSQCFIITYQNNVADFYVFDTADWEVKTKFTIEDSLRSVDIKEDGSEALLVLFSNTENQLQRVSLTNGEVLDSFPREMSQDISGNTSPVPFLSAKYSKDRENILALTINGISKISQTDKTVVFQQKMNIDSAKRAYMVESENGDKLAIQSYSKMYILDGKSGDTTEEIYFPDLDAKYFSYNPSDNTLVGFGEGGKYAIWKDKIIVESDLPFGSSVPSESVFLQNGKKLIVNSHDSQTIKIIDMQSRISSEPIQARIVSNSNDCSKMLLFDGSDFSVSGDCGKTSKKIDLQGAQVYGLMKSGKSYILSNEGRYFASIWVKNESGEPFLALYDLETGEKRELLLSTVNELLRFSDDGKHIYLLNEKEGLKVYRSEDLTEEKSYPEFTDATTDFLLTEDEEYAVFNLFSGTATLYNLKSGKEIGSIPGQVLSIKRNGDEIILKGIQNNTAFTWSNKTELKTVVMDEACAQTPLSFDDVNMYNEKSGLLLMIRNNDTERKAYVVDFNSGQLRMSFTPAVKNYNVNGNISPDGKTIMIDQNYDAKNYYDSSMEKDYFSSAVYHVLSEEEVESEIEKILAGRVLTEEEKEQIGISTK